MDVRFISTTSSRLSELPIVAGQLIYLSDITASYYDIGGQRLFLSGVRVVAQLPQTGQQNVLYAVVNASGYVDSYIWDSSVSEYRMLSGYVATVNNLGLVKPDGTTITIDNNGVISCHAEVTTLPSSAITYDNTISGLSATNAQAAFDEVNTVATGAAASASSAISLAADASAIATSASEAAANASTAANAAQAAVAAQSTAIADIFSRLSAVEAVADIALTVESGNVSE